ncbi:hypothetical protein [Aquisphaera insulae]|uniref:hypothetical protein n=1 Tax=Aquisphaera insulae TaxID=2712864 RepID=UPI0013ECE951|nr:hypothetical protein [Aquisphaera insulae]
MREDRKYAYRYLLYWATLDVRHVAWFSASWFPFWNPFAWSGSIQRVRRAGEIADWVHNLALFSALDFRSFDEERFWADFDSLQKRHSEIDLGYYNQIFEKALSEPTTPT